MHFKENTELKRSETKMTLQKWDKNEIKKKWDKNGIKKIQNLKEVRESTSIIQCTNSTKKGNL